MLCFSTVTRILRHIWQAVICRNVATLLKAHMSWLEQALAICRRPRLLEWPFARGPKSCQYPGHTGKVASVAGRHRSKLSKWTTKYAYCLAKAPLSDHGSTIFPFFFLPPFHTVIYPVKVGGGRGGYSQMGFWPEHGFSNRRHNRQGKYGKPGIIFSGIFNTPNCRLAAHPKKSDINL